MAASLNTLHVDGGQVRILGPQRGRRFLCSFTRHYFTFCLRRSKFRTRRAKPPPGFALGDCEEHFGDSIERTVVWKNGADVSALAGKPVRLRLVLKDADVDAIRFGE